MLANYIMFFFVELRKGDGWVQHEYFWEVDFKISLFLALQGFTY